MSLTMDQMRHSLTVAQKMKALAEENPQKYPVEPNDAFVLGLLHNIGCEFTDKPEKYSKKGGKMLKEQRYKYWKEVYYHGDLQEEYDSVMLRLLNKADVVVKQEEKRKKTGSRKKTSPKNNKM